MVCRESCDQEFTSAGQFRSFEQLLGNVISSHVKQNSSPWLVGALCMWANQAVFLAVYAVFVFFFKYQSKK